MPDYDPMPPASWHQEPVSAPGRRRPRSPWMVVGCVLAGIVALIGLAYLAAVLLAVLALSQSGSNK
jgi:hypothetical protein